MKGARTGLSSTPAQATKINLPKPKFGEHVENSARGATRNENSHVEHRHLKA